MRPFPDKPRVREHLQPRERVIAWTVTSAHGSHEIAYLAVTDQRIALITDGRKHRLVVEESWDDIKAVEIVNDVGVAVIGGIGGGSAKHILKVKVAAGNRRFGPGYVGHFDDVFDAIEAEIAKRAEAAPDPGSNTGTRLLQSLADLHVAGLITDDEYAAKKAEVLERM